MWSVGFPNVRRARGANANWKFVSWVGRGVGAYAGTVGSSQAQVWGPLIETAEFNPGLQILAGSGGSVAYIAGSLVGFVGPGSSALVYASPGTRFVLTAQPSLLQSLVGWSGSASSSSETVTVTLDSPSQVAASFGLNYLEVALIFAAVLLVAGLWRLARRRKAAV